MHQMTSTGCLHSLERERNLCSFKATIMGFLSLAANANLNQFRDQTGNSFGIQAVLVLFFFFFFNL